MLPGSSKDDKEDVDPDGTELAYQFVGVTMGCRALLSGHDVVPGSGRSGYRKGYGVTYEVPLLIEPERDNLPTGSELADVVGRGRADRGGGNAGGSAYGAEGDPLIARF